MEDLIWHVNSTQQPHLRREKLCQILNTCSRRRHGRKKLISRIWLQLSEYKSTKRT